MAGVIASAINVSEALAAATAETVVQIVPAANHPVKLLGWAVSFDGTSVTAEPVTCELCRQDTAGTSSALTPNEKTDFNITLQTAARTDFTAEPTTSTVIERREVHPQSGYEKIYPFGQEPMVQNTERFGIRITAPAIVNAVGELTFEE